MSKSEFPGGQGVVDTLLRTRCKRHLTREQVEAFWLEVSGWLAGRGLKSTVREAERSADGSLDTLPRGDVLDGIAMTLCGRSWPCFGEGDDAWNHFVDVMTVAMNARGWERREPAAA